MIDTRRVSWRKSSRSASQSDCVEVAFVDDLEVSAGRLVFLKENQCVLYWGVRRRTTAADPVVAQTTDLDDGAWSPEVRCSLFLPAMLCWYAGAVPPNTALRHSGGVTVSP